MNELFEVIEKKIKEAGYPRKMISVTRLKEKKTESIFYYPKLRMM